MTKLYAGANCFTADATKLVKYSTCTDMNGKAGAAFTGVCISSNESTKSMIKKSMQTSTDILDITTVGTLIASLHWDLAFRNYTLRSQVLSNETIMKMATGRIGGLIMMAPLALLVGDASH